MKAIYTFLIFAAILLITINASSCKKLTGAGNIKGKVLTKGTDKPVHAALVEVFSKERDIFSSLATLEGEGWTAPDGSFSIDYDAPTGRSIYVMASSAGYVRDLSNDIVYKNGNKKLEVRLIPEAWLKLHLKNVNPSGPGDWISIGAGLQPTIYGDAVDPTINLTVPGNTDFVLGWWVGKRQGRTSNQNSLHCPGHDTTFFEILY